MQTYLVGDWTLVALVFVPFVFGLLSGISYAKKKFIIKMLEVMSDDRLENFMEDDDA